MADDLTKIPAAGAPIEEIVRAFPLPEGVEDGEFNREALAIAMNTSANTVTNWINAGMPVVERGGNGREYRLRLSECFAWQAHRRALEEHSRTSEMRRAHEAAQKLLGLTDSEAEERPILTRKEQIELLEGEIARNKLSMQRRQLLDRHEVAATFSAIAEIVRKFLATLPDFAERELGLDRDQILRIEARTDDVHDEIRAAVETLLRDPSTLPIEPGARQGALAV